MNGNRDALMVFVALTYIFLCQAAHFHSLFISSFVILLDFIVILLGFMTYKEIFGFQIFDLTFTLSFPLTLGGGAIMSVALYDGWRISRDEERSPYEIQDYRGRMADLLIGFVKGGTLRLICNLLVMVIILAIFDTLMFRAVGVYLMIMYLINFFVFLLMFPPFLLFHEVYVLSRYVNQKKTENEDATNEDDDDELTFKRKKCHLFIEERLAHSAPRLMKLKWPLIFIGVVYTVFVVTWIFNKGINMTPIDGGQPFKTGDEYHDVANRFYPRFEDLTGLEEQNYPLRFYWGTRRVMGD
mmetsp:Transcript_1715/g.3031  ORF Transcript_1715/g.3031 Transcript_1715/m.3031 type:complete len:298 (-) Transcript_1715:1135-2028(-)